MTANNYGATNTNPFADEPDTEYHDDPYAFGNNQGGGGPGYQQAGRGAPSMYGDFSGLCDTVSSNIFRINSNITSVDRAMKQIGTPRDSIQLRDKIHSTEQSTNFVINDTAKAFKQLSNICSRSDRQQKLQYERLKGEFQDTVQRYNVLQKKAAEKVKATMPLSSSKVPVADLIGWNDTGTGEQNALEAQRRQEQQEQLQAQEALLDTDLELLQEREERIQQLEADVLDINEIFKDLGMLVHEQGETIDTIEANVESAYSGVEAGNEQLLQAATYQRKARKKMCILVVILVIIAAIITLVIVLSLKKN